MCVKQGYSILQQELSLPILLDVSGIAIEEDQMICTFLNNHLPQESYSSYSYMIIRYSFTKVRTAIALVFFIFL